MRQKVAIALVALTAAACATTYHRMGTNGGYSEMPLAEGQYQVRFSANGQTDPSVVSRFLLRRCAELALENGTRWFQILSTDRVATPEGAGRSAPVTFDAEARIRLLAAKADDAADAVTIVAQTDALAGGQLSAGARATLAKVAPQTAQ